MNIKTHKLLDVCTIIAGQSPESKYYNTDGNGIPFFQGKADFGELYPTIRVYCSQPTKIAEKDDILLSVRAPVGPTNLAPCKVCIGRGLTAIRPNETLNLKYLLFYFRFFEAQLQQKGTGTTFKAITQDTIKNLEIPVPSLPEQERIVARIEELFSQLDKSVETLKKTKAQLAVYRQAVLKEAFEGKLTSHKRGKKEYSEWSVVSIIDLIDKDKNALKAGPFGSALKKESYVQSGYKIYGQEQVISGNENIGDYYIDANKYKELINCKVAPGDVLISLVGTVGKVLVLSSDCRQGIINPRLIKVTLDKNIMEPKFFKYYFESSYLRSLYKTKVHGATMDVLNMRMIKELPFPLCSIQEQHYIITEIESRLSVCESIEKTVDTALQEAEAMRQSILKQAFEGELYA